MSEFKVGDIAVSYVERWQSYIPKGKEFKVIAVLSDSIIIDHGDYSLAWLSEYFIKGPLTKLERLIYGV